MLSSCLWQLWDWIDPQFATMDSKKLQALQQANSHLAPQTKPPTLQHHDFRPSRSPVFQNYPQYQSLASNFAHINPQEQLLHKAATLQQQQQQGYHDQIYQSAHQSRLASHFPGVHQHPTSNLRLQHQFQALEQEKMQQQIRTQNEALMHQQQTFAMRQQMNPPLSNFPSQTSSMTNMSSINNLPQTMQQQQQQQQNNRTLPPSSLNLSNQYQPAQASPMKINNAIQAQQQQQHQQIQMLQNERQLAQQRQLQAVQQQIYHQQQMQFQKQLALQQTPTEVPMIQQNIPGQVVNQAVQTQLSGMKNTNSSNSLKSPTSDSSTTTPSTPSTPSHASLEKRKSEPVHSLKSPVAKRHPNAPVTLAGWLWKQGSEGLKVWRKRWFVLSEYCLFYYKGPEEEKIMGSVLLPSYRISVCTPDDKANRKYAFKCEHTNMRTYVLAAETLDNMAAWVKALTMAAMMQGSSESESQPSIGSSYNNASVGGDNSGDSGIHTFQSKQMGPVTPASDNSQQHQPLYANAPPKPRRATDCGYSSPSPENAIDQYGQMRMRQDPIYGYKQGNRSSAKTPDPVLMQRMQQMRLEQNKSPGALKSQQAYLTEHRSALEQEQYMQKLMLHQQQLQQQKFMANTLPMAYSNERRTPDTYGPSARRANFAGDYEDIYQLGKAQVMPQIAQQQQPPPPPTAVDMSYRRPLSPTKYESNMQIPPMPQRYTPNFLEQQQQQQQTVPMHQQVAMRSKPSLSVARPHSADFLEYEARNPVTTRMKAEPAQAPRPKSSLDINRSQDNVYYSESNYAEKMRQSALYLQKQSYTATPGKGGSGGGDHESYLSQDGATSSLHPSMSSQTLQREIDMVRANRYEINDDIHNGSASVPRGRHNAGKNQQLQQQQQLSQQEQFLRSASARLPKKEEDAKLDGERKREESMKRLLEWKQRMLQSPLTRKGPQLSVAPSHTNSLHLPSKSPLTVQGQGKGYYQSATMDSAQKSNHALQRSRSDTHAISGYGNEDSSEDEDENRVMLAGRSSAAATSTAPISTITSTITTTTNTTSPPNKALRSVLKANNNEHATNARLSVDIESNSHHTITTTTHSLNVTGTQSTHNLPSPPMPPTALSQAMNNSSNKPHNNHNSLINNNNTNNSSAYVPVYKHSYGAVSTTPQKTTPRLSQATLEPKSKHSMAAIKCDESEIDIANNSDADSVIEEKKKLKRMELDEEEEDEADEGQFEYTDNDLDEALLAENDSAAAAAAVNNGENVDDEGEDVDEPMTPINSNAESHYMPMTPKKAILSSSASETSILAMDILNSIRSSTDAIEENPYIEMSSGLSNSSEKQSSSNYELVMLSNADKKDNIEPLYMELANQNSSSIAILPQLLPKINEGSKMASVPPLVTAKKRHSDKGPSRTKKRNHDLPDILKPSQQTYIKSESSSDADDEDISKDPIALKSRTRFSLSDTFRPASYYLGASTSSSIHKNVPLAECLDSSDSEIVPPPPIPSTSPPETEEVFFSSENFNTIKRNSTTSSEIVQHQRTMSAGSSQLSERVSRFSLQDQLFKQQQLQQASSSANAYLNLPQFEKLKNAKLFSTASNCSINTDDGSNTSSDFDLYNKIKLQSPSISADSLNQSSSSLTESSPRPRAISGTAELDDAMFKFEEQNANAKLDHYLNKLETSDLFFSKEQTTWLTESLKHTSQQLDSASLHYENINLMEQQAKHGKTNSASMYYDSLEDVSKATFPAPLKEKNLSIHDALQGDGDKGAPPPEADAIFEMTQPSHSRNNSNLSDSAPYYYSDLGGEAMETLNNQRDMKRTNPNYISHIHNVINKQQLTSILRDQAEKEQGIDSRNLYESGSGRFGQKLVGKDETTTLNDFAHNKIYYHEKNINVTAAAAVGGSAPSTAIDNLLYAKSENLDTSTDGDQLWEEDAIWRESLRRVSQRHARSLDDLDRIESISSSAATKARISDADRQWGVAAAAAASSSSSTTTMERKSRGGGGVVSGSGGGGRMISRDVTYVNEEHQRTLTRKSKSAALNPKLDENDVYVQLACTPASGASDVYEILRDDSNIDRENIRQWDMMSCGRSSSIGSRSQQQKGVMISHKAHSSMDSTLAGADLEMRAKLMKPPNRNGN